MLCDDRKKVARKREAKKTYDANKKVKGIYNKLSAVLNGPSEVLGKMLVWLAAVEAVIMRKNTSNLPLLVICRSF